MTSTPVTNLAQAQNPPVLLSKTGKVLLAVLALLMVGLHWHFLRYTFRLGISDSDWSHVLIIPLISIYYIHMHRQRLMATPRRIAPIGMLFVYFGIGGYIIGSLLLTNAMAMGYSMILTIFGLTLLLLGPAMMKVLWFPIAFLVFMVRVSEAIWSIIASKMQAIAAEGAAVLINMVSALTDMSAVLKGSQIILQYTSNGEYLEAPMNVAEACAGMRMLMAFLALGVALAFLFPRQWWQKLIMVALAAPIAIFVNVLRVAILGWLHLIDPELAHGDFHLLVGMFMLIPAAALLMLVGWCLDKAVIHEGKAKQPPAPLPFDEDPQRVVLPSQPLLKGVAAGVGLFIVLAGAEIVLLRYALPAMGFSSIFTGRFNLQSGGAQLALHAGVAVVAWLGFRAVLSRAGRLPAFGAAAGMLAAAVAGQAGVIQYTGVYLSKLDVPLRHTFTLEFPKLAGDWELLHHDPPLPKDVASELGTKQYFNRYYVNNGDGLYADEIEVVEGKRGEYAGGKGQIEPGQLAKVHIAYYTGMLDAVPHVPDKCWVVAGSKMVYRKPHTLDLYRLDYKPDPEHGGLVLAESEGFDKAVRLPGDTFDAIIFSGADIDGNVTSALYFFLANGQAIASNHEVRFSFSLNDRYSYYCKVEVMFPGVNDPERIEALAEDLLSDLMPEIMACLPDWTEVKAGTYPKKQAGGG